ncbi:MAG: thioredoxin domain-containing protein [Candidatus Rokuibacteriota bacterium]
MKIVALVAVVALTLAPTSGMAQSSEELNSLRREIEALKAGQSAIQNDLQEIKRLLQQRAAPQAPAPSVAVEGLEVTIAGAYIKGSPQARLTIVEFSDYQCPFCARHAQQTMSQIEREFIDTGKVRYAVRNLPLESIHPDAFKAAEAAECAGAQGKFWEMHKLLFANHRALGVAELPRHAATLGLDAAAFRKCLDSGEHAAKVRRDIEDARKAGLTGTPAFFVGVTRGPDPTVRVVRKISGAQPFSAFKATLEAMLAAPDAREK